MKKLTLSSRLSTPLLVGIALTLGGCSALSPSTTPAPIAYTLNDAAPGLVPTTIGGPPRLTLVLNPTGAAAGFASQRMVYSREPYRLDHYAHSEWVDPPARLLGPLLARAIAASGAFRAVVRAPGAATGDWRLDTEIIQLQQDFQTVPSRVRFTLRATLVQDRTRRVLAGREFDASVAAASEDAPGGVVAANAAVQSVLQQLARFCAEAAGSALPD
jgi:cholesterol transport system auxiliary component